MKCVRHPWLGTRVTSRCSFSDESSIIGKYDKPSSAPHKGDRYREKSGRTDAADSDQSLAIDRAREVTGENLHPEGKEPEKKGPGEGEALSPLSVRFSFSERNTRDATGRLPNRLRSFRLEMKPIYIPVKMYKRKNTCYTKENMCNAQ